MDPALQPISWCWAPLLGCHRQMVFTRPEAHRASCFISRNTLGQLVNWSFFVDGVKKKLAWREKCNKTVCLVVTCKKILSPRSKVVHAGCVGVVQWRILRPSDQWPPYSDRRQVPGPTVNNGKGSAERWPGHLHWAQHHALHSPGHKMAVAGQKGENSSEIIINHLP